MASSKLPLLPSLSIRFASKFGFNLDGAASCFKNGVPQRDSIFAIDGSIHDNTTGSDNEERSQTGCHLDRSLQYSTRGSAEVAHPLSENGCDGSQAQNTHCALSRSSLLSPERCSPCGVFVRGLRTLAAEIKSGNVVEHRGKLQEVTKTVWTMQGRGGASIQVELRDISSGTKAVDKWRPDQSLERVQLEERGLTYLYDDGASAVLMDPNTFEQAAIDKKLFGDASVFLKDGLAVKVAFHGQTPVQAFLPTQVRCRVVDAAASFKGERKTASTKMVTLDTGTRIQVPPFIEQGEEILVKTADQSFVARAKGE